MQSTIRKMLFFSLSALASGIISILLRNETYTDLIADTAKYLYMLYILSSTLRLFGSAPPFFAHFLQLSWS